jgi:hypothetical protein
MRIDENWDFETAMYEISSAYRPGGISTGQVRNNLIESWGQLVGRQRALAEFDSTIEKFGSLSAFGREYSVTVSTLRRFRAFFENLPNDQIAENEIKVFISYAHNDKKYALEIYDLLKSNGCSPWIDIHNLKTGQDWELEIGKAIRSSDFFVACLSSNSVSKQGYVQKELKSALSVLELMPEGAVFLLPVKLDECETPRSVSSKHWLDWNSVNAKQKILEAIGIKDTPKTANKNSEIIYVHTGYNFGDFTDKGITIIGKE